MLDNMITTNSLNLNPESLYVVTHKGVVINSICSQGFLFGDNDMGKRFVRRIGPLCACGCGERVKKSRGKWNKYINGHYWKNKNIPKTMKEKMSISHIGKQKSKEHKKRLSIALMGNTNGNGNTSIKGRNLSEETKRKLSLINTGINHPQWKGGISCEPYCEIWTDQEYKQSIRDRDNNQCQNPDCRSNCNHLSLCIHHINYIKKDCHPKNLITLCTGCNSRANTNRKNHTLFYQKIMLEKYGYNYE